MTEQRNHGCPECGAPRGADGTPSCGCTERAAEALRDAREAQAAAAEDFNPLRIRPYVDLEGHGEEPSGDPEATMALRAQAPPPTPDLSLFEPSTHPRHHPEHHPDPAHPTGNRRRGRRLLIGTAAASVAVLAAAGMASGLFNYETPTRETSLPDPVRASVPEGTPETTQKSNPKDATPTPTQTSASPSATESESPSPTPSDSTTSPSGSPSPTTTEPSPTPTPAKASEEPPAEQPTAQPGGPVLRRGDKGPEVVELQLRLRQLYLYNDEINGNFNWRVENALMNYQWSRGVGRESLGVYTAETRAALESETTEP
ncbi:peptidoglycan-binding protein [Streptomyces sp. G1]|uniref:peptidoglycan-binding protein n=1 Tax=Streptomyces sp. G1 TaxID=361572 RepID=UPI00203030D8|nr:peptidoglycan-binding protein [Streptomyces sp. G1]MCM1973379.1 peptidoglycan-binding protein [Streptomyces sp. G1]